MELFVYYNGNFVKASDAHISIYDHSFLYGDGLFETMRSYNGIVYKYDAHMDRFYTGAQRLKINVPHVRSVILKAINILLDRNNLDDAVVRVMLSRGEGSPGIDIDLCPQSTLLITVAPVSEFPEHIYDDGIQLAIVSRLKTPDQTLDSTIKTNNYLNSILARVEAKEKGAQDGILLSMEGYIAECTTSNIFLIKNDEIATPAVETGILKGVARDTIIEIANAFNIVVEERFLMADELYDADECFITNSVKEIVPVVGCDGNEIGNGKVGLVTMNLIKDYKNVINEYIESYAENE